MKLNTTDWYEGQWLMDASLFGKKYFQATPKNEVERLVIGWFLDGKLHGYAKTIWSSGAFYVG